MSLAIFLHLGNPTLWKEFHLILKNVYNYGRKNNYTVDLYISHQISDDNDLNHIKALYPNVILIYSLLGMDIGGQLLMTKKAIELGKDYDYILKIHTKRDIFWRFMLLEPLCISEEIIGRAINHFNGDPTIGMIGTRKYTVQYPSDVWNREIVKEFLDSWNMNITDDMAFIGGTMFWFRWKVMKNFIEDKKIDLQLEYEKFQPGYVNNDTPTVVHSWERIFGLYQYHYGYRLQSL